MATDNTQLNAASTTGDLISTDLLPDGSKVQNVKEGFGGKDSMTQVSLSNPLPVQEQPDILNQILVQLRVMNKILIIIANTTDDLDRMTSEESLIINI
ncbi:MAG TPA: hypothetical protein VGZ90_13320 [Puia sp.]|jgi:hypothetical protein|nr:hypothetical protein [Puia sp.]